MGIFDFFKIFKKKLPDGPYKIFHKNGQLEEEGTIKDGKKDGLLKSLICKKREL